MSSPSDLERRIVRLEQGVALLQQQMQLGVQPLIASSAQTAFSVIGATATTYTGGDQGVFTDPTCGVGLPDALSATVAWSSNPAISGGGNPYDQSAEITLSWDSTAQTWSGCAVLSWPGTVVILTGQAGVGGFAENFGDVACQTPVWLTLAPPAPPAGNGTGYELTVGLLLGNGSITSGPNTFSGPVPIAGQCSSSPNGIAGPTVGPAVACNPWQLTETAVLLSSLGFVGGESADATWNLGIKITTPDGS